VGFSFRPKPWTSVLDHRQRRACEWVSGEPGKWYGLEGPGGAKGARPGKPMSGSLPSDPVPAPRPVRRASGRAGPSVQGGWCRQVEPWLARSPGTNPWPALSPGGAPAHPTATPAHPQLHPRPQARPKTPKTQKPKNPKNPKNPTDLVWPFDVEGHGRAAEAFARWRAGWSNAPPPGRRWAAEALASDADAATGPLSLSTSACSLPPSAPTTHDKTRLDKGHRQDLAV
jgi:hypothetical protein